jgi:hypothetical protein
MWLSAQAMVLTKMVPPLHALKGIKLGVSKPLDGQFKISFGPIAV